MNPDIRTDSIFLNLLFHYSAMFSLPWMCYNPNVLSETRNGTFIWMHGNMTYIQTNMVSLSLCYNILIFHASSMSSTIKWRLSGLFETAQAGWIQMQAQRQADAVK